jgi:hypothetical protein
MRKLGTWGLEVALLVALTAAVAFAGEGAGKSRRFGSGEGLIGKWFSSREAEPAPKPQPKPKKKGEKDPAPEEAVKPPPNLAEERAREEAALLRRLAVCDKLMDIAIRTNDAELLRRAEQLDERARMTYSERTAHLPTSRPVFHSDEQVLDKHLGPGTAATRRAERSDAAARSAGKEASRHAALKEETP